MEIITYTSYSSHYICPRLGYHVYYVINCTTFIAKYVSTESLKLQADLTFYSRCNP